MSSLMRCPIFSLLAIIPVLWSASPTAARDENRAYSSRLLFVQSRESCNNYDIDEVDNSYYILFVGDRISERERLGKIRRCQQREVDRCFHTLEYMGNICVGLFGSDRAARHDCANSEHDRYTICTEKAYRWGWNRWAGCYPP